MKIYLVVKEDDGWGDSIETEVLGAFSTLDGAKASVPDSNGILNHHKLGWRIHAKSGEVYRGRTDTMGDDWNRTHFIQPITLQP